MRLRDARHWPLSLLRAVGLVFVSLGWFIAVIVDRIASLCRPWLPELRALFLSVIAVLAVCFFIGVITSDVHPLAIGVSVLIVAFRWMFPWVALRASVPEKDATFEDTFPQTTWRLCDPNLSTRGLWRAEIPNHDHSEVDIADPERVQRSIRMLVRDWSFRSGWPYLNARVLRCAQASPGRTGPFSTTTEWWTVYRVTLDVGEQDRDTGWIHLGDGFAEFQLEPHLAITVPKAMSTARHPEQTRAISRAEHPLWDRWVDP